MGLADHLREARLTPDVTNHPKVVAARDALRKAKDELAAAEQEMADAGADERRYKEASKKSRTAEKNVTLADKAYRAAKKQAAKEPRQRSVASAAMRKGTCQICGRAFDLVGKGLPNHGWREFGGIKGLRRGTHVGMCYGARRMPLQVSCDAAKELLAELRKIPWPEEPTLVDRQRQALIKLLEHTLTGWKQDRAWMQLVGWS